MTSSLGHPGLQNEIDSKRATTQLFLKVWVLISYLKVKKIEIRFSKVLERKKKGSLFFLHVLEIFKPVKRSIRFYPHPYMIMFSDIQHCVRVQSSF